MPVDQLQYIFLSSLCGGIIGLLIGLILCAFLTRLIIDELGFQKVSDFIAHKYRQYQAKQDKHHAEQT